MKRLELLVEDKKLAEMTMCLSAMITAGGSNSAGASYLFGAIVMGFILVVKYSR
jgi:hypothetical protein